MSMSTFRLSPFRRRRTQEKARIGCASEAKISILPFAFMWRAMRLHFPLHVQCRAPSQWVLESCRMEMEFAPSNAILALIQITLALAIGGLIGALITTWSDRK